MKKKFVFPLILLLCLFSSTAYAKASMGSEQTETVTITSENRFNPAYYQEPKELYPASNIKMARSTALSLEEYVAHALENFETEMDVSAYEIPREDAAATYFQILNSHPSLFYVANSISYSYNLSTGYVTRYKVSYTDTEANIRGQQEDFNQEVKQALLRIDPSMTDVEKALVVHDYLILDCEYDYERLLSNTLPDRSYSAYGALVDKKAVCEGYAKAYSCILEELGISSTIVSSDSMDHAWNMVLIDDDWYHVDVTWDDPVPDQIGRVGHNYFLLSDETISDSEHSHAGWRSGYTADSNVYDDCLWTEISSAFCYQNGTWYYSCYSSRGQMTSLLKKSGHLLTAPESAAFPVDEIWNNYFDNFMYVDLEPTKNEIYFNTKTQIYKIDEAGNIILVYEPEGLEGQLLFGFTVRGSQLYYVLQEAPNIENKQNIHTYTVEDLQLPPITGITAANLETAYDGTAKQITVEGTQEGDRISYQYEDGSYRMELPEMKNAGIYPISYRVERAGHEPYFGNTSIVIRKAEPAYTLPTGLQGNIGSLLGQVELPQGFEWEDDLVELRDEGDITGYVTYRPGDTQNYEIVSHIAVTVTVNAPVPTQTPDNSAQKPTPTQTPDNSAQKPNSTQTPDKVSDPNTTKAPARVKSITVKKKGKTKAKITWKKVTGANGYEIFMRTGKGKYKKVKTITKGKTVTYTQSGLKKKKRYSFRVRAYKNTGGKKLYGKYSKVKRIKI